MALSANRTGPRSHNAYIGAKALSYNLQRPCRLVRCILPLAAQSRAFRRSARTAMIDFAAARRNMVDGQVRTADVTDLRILAAMLEIPRERFVPAASAGLAYLDLDVAARRRPPPAQADGVRQADPGRRYRPPPTACSMSAAPPVTAPPCWRVLPAAWWRWKRTRSLRRSAQLGARRTRRT